MTAYDFWRTTDFEGERRDAIAEARAERVQSAWDAMGYRARADLIDNITWRFRLRGENSRGRKGWLRDRIEERLS